MHYCTTENSVSPETKGGNICTWKHIQDSVYKCALWRCTSQRQFSLRRSSLVGPLGNFLLLLKGTRELHLLILHSSSYKLLSHFFSRSPGDQNEKKNKSMSACAQLQLQVDNTNKPHKSVSNFSFYFTLTIHTHTLSSAVCFCSVHAWTSCGWITSYYTLYSVMWAWRWTTEENGFLVFEERNKRNSINERSFEKCAESLLELCLTRLDLRL